MGELFEQFDIWSAFGQTLYLAFFAAIGALVLGTILAIMRVGPVSVFNKAGTAYVNLVRNTPLTLIVTFCLIALHYQLKIYLAPQDSPTSIVDNGVRWAIVGLAIYHAAFVCEALRSGINTVPTGQAEAARSVGLTFTQTLRYVILPQAFRGAIAPMASVLIALIKNTTVAYAIGVAETAAFMRDGLEFRPDLSLFIFVLVAGFFVLLTMPLGIVLTHLSQRLAVKR